MIEEKSTKKGRLSNAEMDYIRKNIKLNGPDEVALALNRPIETVIDFAKKDGIVFGTNAPEIKVIEAQLSKELRDSPEWTALKDEFTDKELEYFSHRYSRIMAQFKEGILPTEETQVFQVIKFEILMTRNLRGTKKGLGDIRKLETQLAKIYGEDTDLDSLTSEDRNFMTNLENQLLSLRGAQQSKSTEYVKLQEKHSALLKDLKSTRDQRITKMETMTKDVLSLLKNMQMKDFRDSEGKQTALINIAAQREKNRLSEPHKFADGIIDRPLLTPENISYEAESTNE